MNETLTHPQKVYKKCLGLCCVEHSTMATTNDLSITNKETVLAKQAKQASLVLGALPLSDRNAALQKIHSSLLKKQNEILEANKLDMQVPFQSPEQRS